MPYLPPRLTLIKLFIVGTAALIAVFGLLGVSARYEKVRASASGPTPAHTGAPNEANCTSCHTDFPLNSGPGNVRITGIPVNYAPNHSVPVTVTVNQADAVIYGFQLTAIDKQGRRAGTITIPAQMPAQMQLSNGLVNGNQRTYVSHTVNGVIPTQFGTKSWTFTWNPPAQRVGKVSFYVAGNAANSDGDTAGDRIYTSSGATLSGTSISNFDSDLISDVAVYRPSTGVWYALNSSDGNFQAVQFGISEDKIVSADYDGDGVNDFAVWRPSTGVWYVQKSTGGFIIVQFGAQGDVPVVGDYDGDLKSDVAVWRPSTGVWYIIRSSDGSIDIRQFGVATDKIAQGDFDGDGKTDIAVWRPSNGAWYIWKSTDGNFIIFAFGQNGDRPVQADYDGDGRTDAAVFRPSNGVWYLMRSSAGFTAQQFGVGTDIPVPADFDGDGLSDVAVYRDGVWYALRSSNGTALIVAFGQAGDKPVPAGYLSE